MVLPAPAALASLLAFTYAGPGPGIPADHALARALHERASRDAHCRDRLSAWMDRHGPEGERIPATAPAAQRRRILAQRDALIRASLAVDRANTAWLKAEVARHGWPRQSQVGPQGARDAWLLIQHADADPAFQRHCLDRMSALPPGEVDPVKMAYLLDRVLVAEGRPQRYGTQFQRGEDGRLRPYPIEAAEEVDARRKALGMPPLADYAATLEGP